MLTQAELTAYRRHLAHLLSLMEMGSASMSAREIQREIHALSLALIADRLCAIAEPAPGKPVTESVYNGEPPF